MTDAPTLLLILLTGTAAGLLGAFALMRRTILAGDVMSHIAIPGLGLAVLWKINPLLGGGLTLLLGVLIIWQLEKKTGLTTEATIGVIFASSVALGALLINSKEDLIDALFGGFGNLAAPELIFGIGASLLVILALWSLRYRLTLATFSPELAATSKINVSSANLWFLLLFGLTILVSLRFLGALLVGSLIIIPASAARQLTHSFNKFLALSIIFSIASLLLGSWIAGRYSLELGPTIVVTAAIIFVISLFKPNN